MRGIFSQICLFFNGIYLGLQGFFVTITWDISPRIKVRFWEKHIIWGKFDFRAEQDFYFFNYNLRQILLHQKHSFEVVRALIWGFSSN